MSRFYCEVFDVEVVRRQAESIWLGLGDAVLMLEMRGEAEPAPHPRSLDLTCFAATRQERAAIEARVEALGATIEARTTHTIYFRDPEGRRIGASTYDFGSAGG